MKELAYRTTNLQKVSLKDLHFSYLALENAPDAVFWIDAEAKICRVNKAASQHLGYPKSALNAAHIFDLNPDYYTKNWPKIIEKIKQEKKEQVEEEKKY